MTDLAIHCGAHKTATKSLQALLANNRKNLNKAGINYIHPSTINNSSLWPGFFYAQENKSEALKLSRIFEQSMKRDPGLKYIKNPDRVVVSHEGMLSAEGLRPGSSGFYPQVETTLKKFHEYGIFDMFDQVRLILIVRRQDQFLLSLYLYHVVTGLWAEPFEKLIDQLELGVVSWWCLANRMSDAMRNCALHILPFETLPLEGETVFLQDVMSRLLGEDGPTLSGLGRYNESLSQPAYAIAMEAYPHMPKESRKVLGQAIRRRLPVSRFGKPNLVTDELKDKILRSSFRDNEQLFEMFMPDYPLIKRYYLYDDKKTVLSNSATRRGEGDTESTPRPGSSFLTSFTNLLRRRY